MDTEKSSLYYTSLCTVRNKLIENNIIPKDLRYKLYFYKNINDEIIKIKEGDILEGVIYLNIEETIDYSEPVNILYHLEKRITDFEKKFKYCKERKGFIELKKIWDEFKDNNNDCFDYAEWYSIMSPIKPEIFLLNKIALDIRKWLAHKDKIISELNIIYLGTIDQKENEEDYDFINKFLYDV
jgi:hypothetical protein